MPIPISAIRGSSRVLGDAETSADFEDEFPRVAAAPDAEALFAHPLAIFYARNVMTHDMALDVILRDLERRQPVESYDVLSWVRFQSGEFAQALAAERALSLRTTPPVSVRTLFRPDVVVLNARPRQHCDR